MESIKIQIPQELLNPAEMLHLEEDADLEVLRSGAETVRFDRPVHWSVDITNTGGALLVIGKVGGIAEMDCARCLEPASFSIVGDIEGYILIDPASDMPDDLEGDEFEVLDESKTIDLAPMIESALLLEIPRVPLCKDDCKGICAVCGQNRNIEECACDTDEPNDGSSNPFSVLKDYQF